MLKIGLRFKRIDTVKLVLLVCISLLTFLFVFSKHYVNLAEATDAWFTYKGVTPYKDLAITQLPLGWITFIPMHLIFKWSFKDSPFIGLFIGVSMLLLLYFLGKEFFSNALGKTITLLFFTTFFWYLATQITYSHEMLMGLFLTCSLVILFSIYQSNVISLKKFFLLGLSSSLTLLSGQISGITIATLIFIALFLAKLKKYTNKIPFPKSLLLVSIGFFIPLAVILLYMANMGALYEFYKWNVLYYFTYANDAKPGLFQLPWRDLGIYYSPLLVLTILVSFEFFKKKRLALPGLILIILNIATLPFNLFSIFHPHHLLYSLPLTAITAGIVIEYKSIQKDIKNKIVFLWLFLILLMFLFVFVPYYKNHLIYPPTMKIFNDAYPGDNMYEAVSWIRENTPENAKIMVVGNALFYIRSDRLPASRPYSGLPYFWEPINEVRKEILSSPPEYWIVDEQYVARLRKDYSKFDIMGFIDNEMLHCYTLKKSFKKWEIWKRDLSCRITI